MKKKRRTIRVSIFLIIISLFSANLVKAEELNDKKRILEFEGIEQMLEADQGVKVEDLELPKTLNIKLEDEEVFRKVDVEWNCGDYDSQKTGSYIFKSELQEQYLCDEELPDITVVVKEQEVKNSLVTTAANIKSLAAIGETIVVDLSDTNLVSGTGYTVSGTRVTLTDDYDYVLTGTTTRYRVEVSTNTR